MAAVPGMLAGASSRAVVVRGVREAVSPAPRFTGSPENVAITPVVPGHFQGGDISEGASRGALGTGGLFPNRAAVVQAPRFSPTLAVSDRVWVDCYEGGAAVVALLNLLVSEDTFSIAGIKRSMQAFVGHRTPAQTHSLGMIKPQGLDVHQMFDPALFRSGAAVLDDKESPLQAPVMAALHCRSCRICTLHGGVSSSCYFAQMLRCITHGWSPRVSLPIQAVYATHGNYPALSRFHHSARDEFLKMSRHGVVRPVVNPLHWGVISPLGAVLKNSDVIRARMLVGVQIEDQQSLTVANDRLATLGYPLVKARLITDLTATGVNRAAYVPPFRYPSLVDGLRLVYRGCWLAKGDVSRYFHCFPLALESRWLFWVTFLGVIYEMGRCVFGFAPCPYYCSAWSAEFRSWMVAQGIPCTHYMDDWMTVGASEEQARENLRRITATLATAGLAMAKEKEECGQRLTFLGVLIDTVSMRLRFDPVQARGLLSQLTAHRLLLLRGRDLDHSVIRHVAGKLGWYSEVLQSGRLHIHSWWLYCRYGDKLSPALRRQLVADIDWWRQVLRLWASDTPSPLDYRILSASELLADPTSMWILQSDASGTDGFGYYYGHRSTVSPMFVSKSWPPDYCYTSSHEAELLALSDFVQSAAVSDCLLLWITDCLAAVWSVKKGRCFEAAGLVVLRTILDACDRKGLVLLGLWVPRESNELADYLSHLATSLGRTVLSGEIDQLDPSSRHGGAHSRPHEKSSGSTAANMPLRGLVPGAKSSRFSSSVQAGSGLPLPTHTAQPRVDALRPACSRDSATDNRGAGRGLVECRRGPPAHCGSAPTAIRRPFPAQPEAPFVSTNVTAVICEVGSLHARTPRARHHPSPGTQRPATQWRVNVRTAGF